MEKYKFEPIKGEMNTRDITNFFVKNADYIYYLTDVSNTYAVNPRLLEMALLAYKNNTNLATIKKNLKGVISINDCAIIKHRVILHNAVNSKRRLQRFLHTLQKHIV